LRNAVTYAGSVGVIIHAVSKCKIVTRGVTTASKGATVDKSIDDWISASELPEPDAIKVEASDIIMEARSV